jgi:hypothetical protein
MPGSSAEHLLDYLLIFFFVTLLETHLRVSNDAAGVGDVRRSAVGIALSHRRTSSLENGISNSHILVHLAGCLRVIVHGDHINEQAIFAESLVKLLEMDHLLATERSVSREKA